MIRRVIGLSGPNGSGTVVNKRFTRYMNPIINPSLHANALDNSQSWLLDAFETETEWRVFYTGANTQNYVYLDGNRWKNNDATFMAIKTKSNDVLTGWNKVLGSDGHPIPVLRPSFTTTARIDHLQIWLRCVLLEGGVLKGWWVGDNGSGAQVTYQAGYATSNDLGETWTKLSNTEAMYTDPDLGIAPEKGLVDLKVVHDNVNYKMIYSGIRANTVGHSIAESADGVTNWTRIHTGLFANQDFGYPADFRWDGTYYWIWLQKKNMMNENNLGPARDLYLLRSTNLTDWENMGLQMTIKNTAQEFGIANHTKMFQKPNGEWFMLHTYYMNRTQAIAPTTKEPSPATKIAISNNSDSFVMNSACDFLYPDYVTFHAPLDPESGFQEEINGVPGALSSGTPSYWERGFIRLNGSQTLTFPNNGSVINGAHFSIKGRFEIITSGNRELLKIGNDILMTLESGKLRVRLSSDGVSYQKDYITTVNVSKPVGLDYLDNHIYMGFMWDGTTIRMWNDFVEFTSGEITKTVDNALTTVNNSGANILIGQNAAIELRSVSITGQITATEFKELDI
jgi:hypothetical protein